MKDLTHEYVKTLLPPREETQAKWTFGRVMLCCGSAQMPGAAVMSARAALRSGVGLCELASVPSVTAALTSAAPEAILGSLEEGEAGTVSVRAIEPLLVRAKRCSALLCGCGLTVCSDTRALVRALIQSYQGTLVLDADALNIVAESPEILKTAAGALLLTPHERELSRLLGGRRVSAEDAAAFAAGYRVTLLCKGGSESTVVGPGGTLYRLTAPNSGMAKGGSGDVLAGLTAGLAAQGAAPAEAAALGAYLHAMAGRLAREKYGARAMLPTDVIENIGEAFLSLD